jgi:hypothetical protein
MWEEVHSSNVDEPIKLDCDELHKAEAEDEDKDASDTGDDGWTKDRMADFEKEVDWALVEHVQSTPANASGSPCPHLAEAPQDEIRSGGYTEAGSRPEEQRDTSRHDTPAQGLHWEQQIPQGVMETQRMELQEEELAVGDGEDLAAVDGADNPKDEEATKTLPATQLEIGQHYFRLRGIRVRQLTECQTKTTQYKVVWGEHPNRHESWIDQNNVRVLTLLPPCKQSPRDLVSQLETAVRVYRMRRSRDSGSRKIFECLVEGVSTWIPEDQLRSSLSPTLLDELRGK